MENSYKQKLLAYAALSAAAFFLLVLPDGAGISVPLFCLLQCAGIPLLLLNRPEAKNRKGFLFLIPFFLLSLNSFLSGSYIWQPINFLLCMLLLSFTALTVSGEFSAGEQSMKFVGNALAFMVKPVCFFLLPFQWIVGEAKGKGAVVKRALVGLIIALPCLFILVVALASADRVFSMQTRGLIKAVFRLIGSVEIMRLAISALAGLYLFGLLYAVFAPKPRAFVSEKPVPSGDLLIFNIPLASVISVYTIFVFIQFRYLFAGSKTTLPYGLSYADYARHGFFELVALSCVNILLILLYVHFLRGKLYDLPGKSGRLTKGLLLYLCIVTAVMLVSSFYRMRLYNGAYGLTRLRVLVVGFLVFEGVGLLATALYVLRPKFNIYIVYAALALSYYLLLNLVPIDTVIAKRNVDRYFAGEKTDVKYLVSLSADAASQIARLRTSEAKPEVRLQAERYFENIINSQSRKDWRTYNLSIRRAKQIARTHGIPKEGK